MKLANKPASQREHTYIALRVFTALEELRIGCARRAESLDDDERASGGAAEACQYKSGRRAGCGVKEILSVWLHSSCIIVSWTTTQPPNSKPPKQPSDKF